MRTCKNHTCGIDISHKRSHAQYCSRSCKDVESSRRNYEQKESRRKEWRLLNPEKVNSYRKKTKERFGAAYNAKRRVSKTSPTHDTAATKSLSSLASRINKLTKSELQLDHIEPVVHKDICGLNSAANLQLIDAKINRVKSNRRDYQTPLEKLYASTNSTNHRRYLTSASSK